MGLSSERNSRTFAGLDEERIRDNLLLALNAHFHGNATGETANGKGSTDILVRVADRNVFIGECKIWDGQKKFNDAIDQLLGYLTWRDRRCALLIFNRSKGTTAVAQKMHEAMVGRMEYRETVPSDGQGTAQYYFATSEDPNRQIFIATLLFDIPAD